MRLLLLLVCSILLSAASCNSIRRVEDVPIITSDIDAFWAAYPAALRDTAQAYRIFERQYFARASVGLRKYRQQKYRNNPRRFAHNITRRPRFYASMRQDALAIAAEKPRIQAALRRLQMLYPPVRFQPIYFLVGGYAGSTAQSAGLLIGADQLVYGPGVDVSELTPVQRSRLGSVGNVPYIVVHELIHNVQQPHDGTLLSGALREGMADFVAQLVTGSLGANARLHIYGDAHERALWAEFEPAMLGTDATNWLANSQQETPDKPCDLGYYVGYRICQAYYANSTDKKQALADMLTAKDFPSLLRASRYSLKMKTRE